MKKCQRPHPPLTVFMAYKPQGGGTIIWRCSHCQKEDAWGKGWSYYGPLECRCGASGASAVTCSDQCRAEFRSSDPALALELAK